MPVIKENSKLPREFGRGVLKPPQGSNYIILEKTSSKEGKEPLQKGKNIALPEGSGILFKIKHPADGDTEAVYDGRVYKPQTKHKPGLVIIHGNLKEKGHIEIDIGPESGEADHPILGKILYLSNKC